MQDFEAVLHEKKIRRGYSSSTTPQDHPSQCRDNHGCRGLREVTEGKDKMVFVQILGYDFIHPFRGRQESIAGQIGKAKAVDWKFEVCEVSGIRDFQPNFMMVRALNGNRSLAKIAASLNPSKDPINLT